MLGLTLDKGQTITIHHAGETLIVKRSPKKSGRLLFNGPHTFHVIRDDARVKLDPEHGPGPERAA